MKLIYSLFFFLLSATFLLNLTSCESDPETIIKTVTVHDTIVISQTDTVNITQFIQDTTTTFILSRHTETTGSGSDPVLSVAGQERVVELTRVLKNTTIHAVYSTNFNRTKQTANAIATLNGLTTQIYDAAKLDELINTIFQLYKNKVVYIAGHSNTTNVLLNVLVGSNVYPIIPDTEYDNLYIVNAAEKGRAKVVHLKYGK